MIKTELKKGRELEEGDLFYLSETPGPTDRALTLVEVESEHPGGSAVTPHPHRIILVPGTTTPRPTRPIILYNNTWYAVPVQEEVADVDGASGSVACSRLEALDEIVHAAASEMATNACNGGESDMMDFLRIVAGWANEDIEKSIASLQK